MSEESSLTFGRQREKTIIAQGGSLHLSDASQKNVDLDKRHVKKEKVLDTEMEYKVKANYHRKLSIRQHLLQLKADLKHVKYLDGEKRGVPRDQWDNTVEEKKERKSKLEANWFGRKRRSKSSRCMEDPFTRSSSNLSKVEGKSPSRTYLSGLKVTQDTSESRPRLHSRFTFDEDDQSTCVSLDEMSQLTRTKQRPHTTQNSGHMTRSRSARDHQNRRKPRVISPVQNEQKETVFPKIHDKGQSQKDFITGYLSRRRRSKSLSDIRDLKLTFPPVSLMLSSGEEGSEDELNLTADQVIVSRKY